MRYRTIDDDILAFLQKEDWPDICKRIAEAVGVSPSGAKLHLDKMWWDGRVRYKRTGNSILWMSSGLVELVEKHRTTLSSNGKIVLQTQN